ncbi:hypothetical protein [Streptomyces zagrosensis]|uniref:Putative membrane protein YqjE n=1 Tax=Streptomyces zagrosensis TaxID=1042984 RepID=A0A7W9QGS3_9ACTN|nr:hypothetical protein [Streptomyces zagrosensis]MBB5939831.1 putative membrane protein YqjE [Streptomyces zagrosensis]
MLVLVALFLLMSVVVGAAAHTTLPVFLVAAAVIGGWLLIFSIREHRARTRFH